MATKIQCDLLRIRKKTTEKIDLLSQLVIKQGNINLQSLLLFLFRHRSTQLRKQTTRSQRGLIITITTIPTDPFTIHTSQAKYVTTHLIFVQNYI